MDFFKKFKNLYGSVFTNIHPPVYTRTQRYRSEYSVRMKNISETRKEAFVVIPVPSHTPNQTILSGPFFSERLRIQKDALLVNRYALWNIGLAPHDSVEFREIFDVVVAPLEVLEYQPCYFSEYGEIHANIQKNFCSANYYIDPHSEQIQKLARELKGDEEVVYNVIRNINRYVVHTIDYGNPIDGLYSSNEALSKKKVDCGGFDTLLVALCLALGIPARVAAGFWAGYKHNDMHAWVEIMLPDGKWMPADPSVEKLSWEGRTRKAGRLGYVGSDRIAFSHGCSIPVELAGKIEYIALLQHPSVFPHNVRNDFQVSTILRTSPPLI